MNKTQVLVNSFVIIAIGYFLYWNSAPSSSPTPAPDLVAEQEKTIQEQKMTISELERKMENRQVQFNKLVNELEKFKSELKSAQAEVSNLKKQLSERDKQALINSLNYSKAPESPLRSFKPVLPPEVIPSKPKEVIVKKEKPIENKKITGQSLWVKIKEFFNPSDKIVLEAKPSYSPNEARVIYEANLLRAQNEKIPEKVLSLYERALKNEISNLDLKFSEDNHALNKAFILLVPEGSLVFVMKIYKETPPHLDNGQHAFDVLLTFNDKTVLQFTGNMDEKKKPTWFDLDVLAYVPSDWTDYLAEEGREKK